MDGAFVAMVSLGHVGTLEYCRPRSSLTLDRYFAQFSLFAQLNSTNTSVGIITNTPFGNPVNFRMSLDKNVSRSTDQGLYLRLNVRRSGAVRFLVVIIVLANCTSTIHCDERHPLADVPKKFHAARAC